MAKKIFLLSLASILILFFAFFDKNFPVKALNCAADQCYWGGGGYSAEECVPNGDKRENSQGRLVCRNGQWKTDLNGWGCNNSSWPCDQGYCQQVNGSYYCRNCVVDPGLSADAKCATGQCFWGPGNGHFTNQCVLSGDRRENSWVRMICRNGVWKIDYNGWGCEGSMGFECDSGACKKVGGYNYCVDVLPLPATAGAALDQANLGTICSGCNRNCSGKTCGPDGCGGSCGTCSAGTTCSTSGQCVSDCVPSTCASLNYPCGTISDGCGGTLTNCSVCVSGFLCRNNQCVSGCSTNCSGKTCGPDGCGGSCGTCSAGTTCSTSGQCVSDCVPNNIKKCDGDNLYWYDSCGEKGDLAQNCGIDSLTDEYRCNGNWLQQGVADNNCSNGACVQNKNWTNVQNCELSGKVCRNSVCAADDFQPPLISGPLPSGIVYSPNVVLSVRTNEAASCRYGLEDVDYGVLASQFTSTDKLYHTAFLVLSSFGDQFYYVRCRDAAGNDDKNSIKISFVYAKKQNGNGGQSSDAESPKLSNPEPTGEVAADKVTISAATDEKATCKYDITDGDYENMTNYMESADNGTKHTKNIILSEPGLKIYFVRCKDDKGNTNKESLSIKFNYGFKQKPGPAISELQPTGIIYQNEVALAAKTDRVATCRYSLQDGDFASMAGLFESPDGLQQMAAVALEDYGEYLYYVRCQDEDGNDQGSFATMGFVYKNPKEQDIAVADAPAADCVSRTIAESDGNCVADENCICDPDCTDDNNSNDPDCVEIGSGDKPGVNKNAGGIAVAIGVFTVLAVAAILALLKKRLAGGSAANEDGEQDLF